MTPDITVIIPVRLSPDYIYDEPRRLRRIAAALPKDIFSLVWVDEGTAPPRDQELAALAKELDVRLMRSCQPGEPFSIGRARDCGVRHAQTPLVMIHDLDLLAQPATYRNIAEEARLRHLTATIYDFFTVPAIFLSEAGTHAYLTHETEVVSQLSVSDRTVHDWSLRGREDMVEHFAISPSILVINRLSYMAMGGHDESFYGHGAEDFEFYHRANAVGPRAKRPSDYEMDYPFKIGVYSGFRSYFALRGIELWMRGVAMVHLWHPRREVSEADYARSKENFSLLTQRMRAFDEIGAAPPPLVDPSTPKTRPLMVADGTHWRSLRFIAPLLGAEDPINPAECVDASALLQRLEADGADRVMIMAGDEEAEALVHGLNLPVLSFGLNTDGAGWQIQDVSATPPIPIAIAYGNRFDAGPLNGVIAFEYIELEGEVLTLGSPPHPLPESAPVLQVIGTQRAKRRDELGGGSENPLAVLSLWANKTRGRLSAWECVAALAPRAVLRFLPGSKNLFSLWSQAGDWYRDCGNFSAARESYRRAVACEPKAFDYLVQLGHMAKETGDRDLAAKAYCAALKMFPDNADLSCQIGHFHMSGGAFRDAATYYGRAVSIAPYNTEYQSFLEQAETGAASLTSAP